MNQNYEENGNSLYELDMDCIKEQAEMESDFSVANISVEGMGIDSGCGCGNHQGRTMDHGCGNHQGRPMDSGCGSQKAERAADHGCGCGNHQERPMDSGCGNQKAERAADHGCGCGNHQGRPMDSGCGSQKAERAADNGCGCGNHQGRPMDLGCGNQKRENTFDNGCGCGEIKQESTRKKGNSCKTQINSNCGCRNGCNSNLCLLLLLLFCCQ